MQILQTNGWSDYELIDSGLGYRLERFGKYIVQRPDPQAIWQPRLSEETWKKADAVFERGKDGKERWFNLNRVPDRWKMRYKDLTFWAKLAPFKHTGVFPEQVLQWDWMRTKLTQVERETNVLNLFAYTGIASLVAASTGSKVTHLDASKPTIGWARENQDLSGLAKAPIRWILDDAVKFIQREIRRGVRYDGVIMDPPVYGHGPNGEKWNFLQHFPHLLELVRQVLTPQPLFIIVNAYAVSASALMLENVLSDMTRDMGGRIETGELALQESSAKGRLLSTGIFARWSR
jgi:23S rRNA (cytosine1962-C5)-methyltransferase